MGIGPYIRQAFGRHEQAIAELYRGFYFNLDAYADQIADWVPRPARILEVGCGEGAVTQRLARRFPDAQILGIDIMPRVGRLFTGPRDHVHFEETTVQAIADREPGAFDLAVISDVMHHVPIDLRDAVLDATRRAIAPGGVLVLKDWERTATPIHWLCHGSDRWLTGDKVRYMRQPEARAMLARTFGSDAIVADARFAPWKNNFAMLIRV